MSILGEAHIWIIKALEIIAETGGSIVCSPDANRVWKVMNSDCSCESSNLSLSCRHFVTTLESREYLDGT